MVDCKRFICIKDGLNFSNEYNYLIKSWVSKNIIFDPRYFEVDGCKVSNLVINPVTANMDYYEKYDLEKSMADNTSFSEEDVISDKSDSIL